MGCQNTPEGEFCTLHFSKTKIYKPHYNMYVNSKAVTALLRYPEIIGIPIKLFLIPRDNISLDFLLYSNEKQNDYIQ